MLASTKPSMRASCGKVSRRRCLMYSSARSARATPRHCLEIRRPLSDGIITDVVRNSDFQRALDRRPRAGLAAPALEVRHAGDELGERALGAPVAGIERKVGDGEFVAGGVLA